MGVAMSFQIDLIAVYHMYSAVFDSDVTWLAASCTVFGGIFCFAAAVGGSN